MASIEQLTDRIAQAVATAEPLPHVVKIDLKGAGFIHIDGSQVTNQDAPADLVGRQFLFVANLEPRKVFGLLSEAMVLAGHDDDGLAAFSPLRPLPAGAKAS